MGRWSLLVWLDLLKGLNPSAQHVGFGKVSITGCPALSKPIQSFRTLGYHVECLALLSLFSAQCIQLSYQDFDTQSWTDNQGSCRGLQLPSYRV